MIVDQAALMVSEQAESLNVTCSPLSQSINKTK